MRKRFCAIFLIPLFYFTGYAQQAKIDSLRKELRHAKSDNSKVKILDLLGDIYSELKPDSAILFLEEGLLLSQQLNYTKGEIKSLISLGSVYRNTGSNLKAGHAWQKALELSENTKDSVNMVAALNSYGYIYSVQGDYKKELSLYQRAEKIARQLNNAFLLDYSLVQMGNAYLALHQLDSAEFVFREVRTRFNFFVLARLAGIKSERNQIDSALSYFRLSNKRILEDTIGDVYLVENYSGMSKLFDKNNQKDSAFYYAKKSFESASKTFDSSNFIIPSDQLAKLWEDKRNYKEALGFLKLSKRLNDSLYGRDKQKELIDFTFEEQQRKQEIESAKSKYKSEVRFYVMLASTGILVLAAFLLYRNSRNKQKVNALLTRQKEKVESTLADLKSTQSQLIQSEKMASLGELTAGIAHEIQNPLNFVNNFSELNAELVDELQQDLKSGKIEEAISTSNDIKENEQKINYHGKRADAIVKGMLQHSRASSGQKELTDINELVDEYLRLAYHGLRAKDKSFNAIFKTDLDNSIGKINIVPQDIGRVVLNLINNAFYAVIEKKKQHPDSYEPTVTVTTKKIDNKVELRVTDNGNGIPQKVLDKIFQPFFTTKPTGEGTGLGLSLSYDIITKGHGGELKVETKEGDGSTFIIQLQG